MFARGFLLPFLLVSMASSATEISFRTPRHDNNKDMRIDYDEEAGIIFGRGYDTLSDSIKGDCIESAVSETPDGSEAQKTAFSIHHITSSVDLMKKLNLAAAASVKMGWGRGSAKTEFASQYSLSSYSVYVMAKVLVRNVMKTVRYAKLTEAARNLYHANPSRFRKTCGDDYVGAMTSGGEFYAVIEIETKTESQKTDVMAKLKGRVGTVSGSVDFSSSLSEITKDYQAKIAVYQVGGSFDPKIGVPSTPEQIIEHAKKFPSLVVGKDAMPISATTFPYTSLADLPLDVEPMAIEHQEEVIKKMIDYQNAYLTDIANIDYILFNPDQFIDPVASELNAAKKELIKQTNLVMKVAKKCFADLTSCEFPEDLEYPTYKLPKRVQGLFYKDLCEFKAHESCGPQVYNLKEGAECGVKEYKAGTGPVCGVELYKLGRSESCGVIRYNEKTDPRCGQVKGYLKQEYDPGYRNCLPGRDNVDVAQAVNSGAVEKFFADHSQWSCPRQTPKPENNSWQTVCQNTVSGHWWVLCKGMIDATCRRPEFGIELAELCRAPEHGVERYLPCRDKTFGVETYMSCRHSNFGVEEYKHCYAPKERVEGETEKPGQIKCSQDPKDYK